MNVSLTLERSCGTGRAYLFTQKGQRYKAEIFYAVSQQCYLPHHHAALFENLPVVHECRCFISTKMYYKFHKHVLGSKMVCQCYTKLLNICIIVITVALICMLLSTAVDV